jgi:hypothetical protein
MKIVLSGLLTVVLSGNSETVAGISLTEFLHENSKITNEHITNTFNRESIYFLILNRINNFYLMTPFPVSPKGRAERQKLPCGQF